MDTCLTCGKKVVDLTPAMLSSGGPGWWCLCPRQVIEAGPVFLYEETPQEPAPVPEPEPTPEATVTFTPAEPEPAPADPGPEDPAV